MFLLPIVAILLLPSEVRGQHGPVSVRSLVVGVGCAPLTGAIARFRIQLWLRTDKTSS
jgi:hypothetical protein